MEIEDQEHLRIEEHEQEIGRCACPRVGEEGNIGPGAIQQQFLETRPRDF